MNVNRIFLTGFMGAGKTTIGKILSRRLNCFFIDLDQEIELYTGQSISKIFEEKGEKYFRKLEEEMLEKIIVSTKKAVIATGGGIILSKKNRRLLSVSGLRIFLDVPLEIILQRIRHSTHRPLLNSSNLAKIYANRMKFYSECDMSIHTKEFNTPYEAAVYIEKKIREKPVNNEV